MNKLLLMFVFIFFVSASLYSQQSFTFSFVEYMEELQYSKPREAIKWFKENVYSETLAVDEAVFNFYKGISLFASYVIYQGTESDMRTALISFRDAITLPPDSVFYYSDRAFLYISAGLMLVAENVEVASRMFNYYVSTRDKSNPFYNTALFWFTYLRHLQAVQYEANYNYLDNISKQNVEISIYNYSRMSYIPLSNMMRELSTPDKAKLLRYQWTLDEMNITSLMNNALLAYFGTPIKTKPFTKEEIELQDKVIIEGITPQESLTPQEETKKEATTNQENTKGYSDSLYNGNGYSNNNGTSYNTTSTIPQTYTDYTTSTTTPYSVPSPEDNVKIVIENTKGAQIKVEIYNKIYSTTYSTNYSFYVATSGNYDIIVTQDGYQYKGKVKIDKDKDNIISIVNPQDLYGSSSLERSKYIISKNSILEAKNVVLDGYDRDKNAKKNKDFLRKSLAENASTDIAWFKNNPYNSNMGLTSEEYAYYRGVAYYSDFLKNKNPAYASQALLDLEHAYKKKDDNIFTINTELYLAAVEIFAYNNLDEASKLLQSALTTVDKLDNKNKNYYMPTILYWSARVNLPDEKQIENIGKYPDSSVVIALDTRKFETLSDVKKNITNSLKVSPVKTVKATLEVPSYEEEYYKITQNTGEAYIPSFINTTTKGYKITLLSLNEKKLNLPYKKNIYEGVNSFNIRNKENTIYFDVNASKGENYFILFTT